MVDFSDNKDPGRRPTSRKCFDPANPNSMSSIYRDVPRNLEVTGEVIPYVRATALHVPHAGGTEITTRTMPGLYSTLTEIARPTT
jgi:hypothetical protein